MGHRRLLDHLNRLAVAVLGWSPLVLRNDLLDHGADARRHAGGVFGMQRLKLSLQLLPACYSALGAKHLLGFGRRAPLEVVKQLLEELLAWPQAAEADLHLILGNAREANQRLGHIRSEEQTSE